MRDLVLVQKDDFSKEILYEAPICTGLKRGDVVAIPDGKGEDHGTVVMSCSVYNECSEAEMIIHLARAKEPLPRIIATFKRQEVTYHE